MEDYLLIPGKKNGFGALSYEGLNLEERRSYGIGSHSWEIVLRYLALQLVSVGDSHSVNGIVVSDS